MGSMPFCMLSAMLILTFEIVMLVGEPLSQSPDSDAMHALFWCSVGRCNVIVDTGVGAREAAEGAWTNYLAPPKPRPGLIDLCEGSEAPSASLARLLINSQSLCRGPPTSKSLGAFQHRYTTIIWLVFTPNIGLKSILKLIR